MGDIYIDPDFPTNGAGTIGDPHNIWPALSNNNNYFQKRQTNINLSANIFLTGLTNITIDAYGTGSEPIISGYITLTTAIDWTEVAADIWEFDSGILADRSYVVIGLGSLGDKDNPTLKTRVNYLGGGTGTSGAGAFTEFGQWEHVIGSGAVTAKLYIYADQNPVTKWGTIYAVDKNSGKLFWIRNGSTNITIQNIHFMHYFEAVESLGASSSNSNITVQDNIIEHGYNAIKLRSVVANHDNHLIQRNKLYANGNIGINIANSQGFGNRVILNEIHDTGVNQASGIGAIYGQMVAASEFLIEANYIDGVYRGLYWSGEAFGLYTENSSINVRFQRNFVTNCVDAAGLHTNGGTNDGVIFNGNLVIDCDEGFLSTDGAAIRTDEFSVCNNVFINVRVGIRYNRLTALGTMSTLLKNNVIISSGVSGIGINVDADVVTLNGVDEDYNNVYDFDTTITGLTLGSNSDEVDPLITVSYAFPENSPVIGTGVKWWTGANPVGYNGEPISDFDIDRGHIQSTYGPFHTKNL